MSAPPDSSRRPAPAPPASPAAVSPYSVADRRAERDRRARVRAEWLDRLPHPDEPMLVGERGDRADRWPPRPTLPPPAKRGRPRYSPEYLRETLREFGAARGPDFAMHEFLRWSGTSERPYYDRFGSWTAARLAAGLPGAARQPDRKLRTLHKLLRVTHLNGGRRMTAAQLGRSAGVSAPTVYALGGPDRIRYLYRLWADPKTKRAGSGGS